MFYSSFSGLDPRPGIYNLGLRIRTAIPCEAERRTDET